MRYRAGVFVERDTVRFFDLGKRVSMLGLIGTIGNGVPPLLASLCSGILSLLFQRLQSHVWLPGQGNLSP